MRSEPSVPGRIFVIVVAIVATLSGILGWRALHRRPVPTTIVDIANLDGEYAVVIRDVAGEPDRSFISLFHTANDGATIRESWGAVIPAYAARGKDHSAVAATTEVVAVRTVIDGWPNIIAFDARHGRKLGSVFPLGGPPVAAAASFEPPGVPSLADEGQAFELFGAPGSWSRVVSLDLVQGKVQATIETGSAVIERAWLRPGHVILERADALTFLARESAQTSRIAKNGRVCVTDDAIYFLARESVLATVTLANLLGDPVEHRIALPGGDTLAGTCGVYEGQLILAVTTGQGLGSLVAVGNDASAPAWRIDLEHPWPADLASQPYPDEMSMAGALTRFVPVLVGAPGSAVLAMVDVASGQIAWQSPPRPSLHGARLMQIAGQHYLYAPRSRILAAFGGESGKLGAAVELAGYGAVRPYQIAGGRIWLSAGQRFQVIDAVTLQGLAHGSAPGGPRDVKTQLSSELGLAP